MSEYKKSQQNIDILTSCERCFRYNYPVNHYSLYHQPYHWHHHRCNLHHTHSFAFLFTSFLFRLGSDTRASCSNHSWGCCIFCFGNVDYTVKHRVYTPVYKPGTVKFLLSRPIYFRKCNRSIVVFIMINAR